MEEGIDSLSLNPDTVVQTRLGLAELKNKFALTGPIPGSDAGDFFTGVRLSGVVMRRAKSPSWEMGKDYTQQFVVSLRISMLINQGVDL